MKLFISGPNAHSGMFHVHKAGCVDLNKGVYRRLNPNDNYSEAYLEDHDSVESVVLAVYDNGIMDHDAGETYQDYVGEFKFFPCTNELPNTEN